jgi:hypothetical protein
MILLKYRGMHPLPAQKNTPATILFSSAEHPLRASFVQLAAPVSLTSDTLGLIIAWNQYKARNKSCLQNQQDSLALPG